MRTLRFELGVVVIRGPTRYQLDHGGAPIQIRGRNKGTKIYSYIL